MDVAGDVKIPSARIQPAQLTGAVKASDDARYVGEHPAERAGLFVVHSEVRIDMGDDVRVDAFGLQGRIVGGVGTTVQTGEAPIGRGELSVDEGRYEAFGQKLEINRGRLLFDVSPLDDPGLDIEARRRIETTEVGLNVRGTLQEPRLTFFSDPSMTQSQIVSYLLTGKSVDSITGSGDGELQPSRATRWRCRAAASSRRSWADASASRKSASKARSTAPARRTPRWCSANSCRRGCSSATASR